MRVTPAQLERVSAALVRQLARANAVEWTAPETAIQRRFTDLLQQNFDEEAAIERQAAAEAEKLMRQGAPGVRRDELDQRKVEQLVKQRLAKTKGFVL